MDFINIFHGNGLKQKMEEDKKDWKGKCIKADKLCAAHYGHLPKET